MENEGEGIAIRHEKSKAKAPSRLSPLKGKGQEERPNIQVQEQKGGMPNARLSDTCKQGDFFFVFWKNPQGYAVM